MKLGTVIPRFLTQTLSRAIFDRGENKGGKGGSLPYAQFLTDFNDY